jgi:hypothetical protein
MGRESPDHKRETGSESYGGMHNRQVLGSSPSGPTIVFFILSSALIICVIVRYENGVITSL